MRDDKAIQLDRHGALPPSPRLRRTGRAPRDDKPNGGPGGCVTGGFAPTWRRMKKFLTLCLLAVLAAGASAQTTGNGWLMLEEQVAAAVKGPQVTVVHFWAPWCPNCAAELKNNGWSTFLDTNFDVNFIFVTVWNAEDGRAVLEKNGVGAQKNFQLLLHPNASRNADDKMTTFLGLPVTWIPTTWVFRDGKLRYALNYGELRFPLLQQLIRDASDKWEHK